MYVPPKLPGERRSTKKFVGEEDVIRMWPRKYRSSPTDNMSDEYRKQIMDSDKLCESRSSTCPSKGIDWGYVSDSMSTQQFLFIAEKDGMQGDWVCGILGCTERENSILHIEFLCSDANAGSALLVTAAKFAKKRGLTHIELESVYGAISFYLRWSFIIDGMNTEIIGKDDITQFNSVRLNNLYLMASVEDILSLAQRRAIKTGRLIKESNSTK